MSYKKTIVTCAAFATSHLLTGCKTFDKNDSKSSTKTTDVDSGEVSEVERQEAIETFSETLITQMDLAAEKIEAAKEKSEEKRAKVWVKSVYDVFWLKGVLYPLNYYIGVYLSDTKKVKGEEEEGKKTVTAFPTVEALLKFTKYVFKEEKFSNTYEHKNAVKEARTSLANLKKVVVANRVAGFKVSDSLQQKVEELREELDHKHDNKPFERLMKRWDTFLETLVEEKKETIPSEASTASLTTTTKKGKRHTRISP